MIKLNNLFLLLCFSFCSLSFGQSIDKIQIIPESATEEDTLFLVIDYTIPWGPCEKIDSVLIQKNNNVLNVDLYIEVGPQDPILQCKDTIKLGLCDAGAYQLMTRLFHAASSGYELDDEDTSDFEVMKIVSSLNSQNLENKFEQTIYPNPVSEVLFIKHSNAQIIIYNSNGQKILDTYSIQGQVDLSFLKRGVYFLIVASEKGLLKSSFVKY